ncbi:MAG: IS1096 element passenger TnpR family protein, partial [Polaribacter sp.]
MYKIRIILDTKEDVIRTILVDDAIHLEELHTTIATSFGFEGQEMASFYRTDSEWNQGEEIPLFNMAEAGVGVSMATEILFEALPKENDKLIYVYDFLNMWTFYVEVVEISSDKVEEAKIVLS